MDDTDRKALLRLQKNGRESWAALGTALGMTGPAAAERVRRLEERGVIRGYAALLDPERVGAELTAFVAVTLDRPQARAPFLKRVAALAEVQECHHVAGDDDYLLKVRCRNAADLDRVLTEELRGVAGVARTRTTIVLRTAKDTPALPIADEASRERRRDAI